MCRSRLAGDRGESGAPRCKDRRQAGSYRGGSSVGVDQGAGKIASAATTQPSDAQSDRLQANDRAQPSNSASNMVEMAQGKFQVELGVKVAKASDEMLGTLIDTYA